MENTSMGKTVAQELGERVNDHLPYKLVQLRVQKMLQNLAGSTASSKTTVANNVRSRGWTDQARIVDSTLALRKPAPVSENRRSTRHTPTEDTTPNSHSWGVQHVLLHFHICYRQHAEGDWLRDKSALAFPSDLREDRFRQWCFWTRRSSNDPDQQTRSCMWLSHRCDHHTVRNVPTWKHAI